MFPLYILTLHPWSGGRWKWKRIWFQARRKQASAINMLVVPAEGGGRRLFLVKCRKGNEQNEEKLARRGREREQLLQEYEGRREGSEWSANIHLLPREGLTLTDWTSDRVRAQLLLCTDTYKLIPAAGCRWRIRNSPPGLSSSVGA